MGRNLRLAGIRPSRRRCEPSRLRHGNIRRRVVLYLELGQSAAQALTNPTDSFSVAAAWESTTSFTLGVNLTDGQAHNITLYAVDFDDQGLNEQIQILSAATGVVLDTKTLWSFSGGIYLQWVVSSDILIQVTNLSGPDAVLSGDSLTRQVRRLRRLGLPHLPDRTRRRKGTGSRPMARRDMTS